MKYKTILLCLLMISSAVAGCIRGEELGEDDEQHLRIVSYDAFGIGEEMLAEFTNETGITVEITKVGDAGSVLATAIQTKDSGLFDLALGIDNSYLGAAISADIFQPLSVDRTGLSARSLEAYDGDLAIPFDVGSVCINYDSNYVDGENVTAPTSLWNFTEADWNGKVAVQNPRTSSPGRAFLIATTYYFANDENNQTDYTDWWQSMQENDVITSDGWTTAYETHYSAGYGQWGEGHIGDAKAVVSYCHSPGVEAYFGENWTASVALNISGASFAQIEYATLLAGSQNSESATLFVEWLLSTEINSQMSTLNWMYPAIEGGDLTEVAGYRWHSVIPVDADVSTAEIEANIADWLDGWDAALG